MTALQAKLDEMSAEFIVKKKALLDVQKELQKLKNADKDPLAKELGGVAKAVRADPAEPCLCGKTITLRTPDGKMLTGNHGRYPVAPWGGSDGNEHRFTVEFAGDGKVSLKSCAQYLSASYGNGCEGVIYCNARSVGNAEMFEWIVNEDGTISLRGHNGKFASVNKDLSDRLTCSGNFNGSSERFVVVD